MVWMSEYEKSSAKACDVRRLDIPINDDKSVGLLTTSRYIRWPTKQQRNEMTKLKAKRHHT